MTCIYKWKHLNCNSKWVYENAWRCLKNQEIMSIFMNENGIKVICKYKWWLKMTYIYDWDFIRNDSWNPFINMIRIWKWLMKISENGKPIINTSEIIFWIMIWKIMISMRIKMFALNSMEKKCMNNRRHRLK